jgi:uncharacterized protein YqjF (DUF2071 family)
VDPAILAPWVPAGTELDLYNGEAFVSMVGFLFLNTRVFGISIPFHTDFEEVNLRFYVRRFEGGECRRGVVFVKELVPKWAVAAVARLAYGERYQRLPMRYEVRYPSGSESPEGGALEYCWKRGGEWEWLKGSVVGGWRVPDAGGFEEFIAEHYWGYVSRRSGQTVEYGVEHPRWRVAPVAGAELRCTVRTLYGSAFESGLTAQPVGAFLADGSAVTVRRGRILS